VRARPAIPLIALVASAALAACGEADPDGVFDRAGYPFEFSYPEPLAETEDVTVAQQLGNAAEETVAIGIDENNAILVQRFELEIPIDEHNLGLAKLELERLLTGVDPDVRLGETSVAGFPALTADDVTVRTIPGGVSDLTVLFDGNQEYLLNCQSSDEHRAEIERACEQMVDSLEPTA
jgi:hypothetical protein